MAKHTWRRRAAATLRVVESVLCADDVVCQIPTVEPNLNHKPENGSHHSKNMTSKCACFRLWHSHLHSFHFSTSTSLTLCAARPFPPPPPAPLVSCWPFCWAPPLQLPQGFLCGRAPRLMVPAALLQPLPGLLQERTPMRQGRGVRRNRQRGGSWTVVVVAVLTATTMMMMILRGYVAAQKNA